MKEELQRRPKSTANAPASLGAAKITQLENQIKFYRTREDEQKTLISNFESEIELLSRKLQNSEQQKNVSVNENGKKVFLTMTMEFGGKRGMSRSVLTLLLVKDYKL